MTDIATNAPQDGGQAAEGTNKPWYDGADADTIGFVQNKKWENPLQAIDAYRNLEKFHGVPADQIIKMPKQDDPASWESLYNRLGRPETADKYGRENLKIPDSIEIDDAKMSQWDELVHKAGLTRAQRDAVLNAYFEDMGATVSNFEDTHSQERAIEEASLRKEWGTKYDERVELARRAFRSFLPEGVDKDALAGLLEKNLGVAITAKLFANIADRMAEDTFHEDNGGNDRKFGYTKEQATYDRNSLMSELRADAARLATYNKGVGPDYEKMKRLNKMIAEG